MVAQLLEFIPPIERGQIFLVRAVEPFEHVVGGKADAVPGQLLHDLLVGFVIVKELVDQSTLFGGELGDFALGATAAAGFEGGRTGLLECWIDGWLELGAGGGSGVSG